jgi:hypothetical protein
MADLGGRGRAALGPTQRLPHPFLEDARSRRDCQERWECRVCRSYALLGRRSHHRAEGGAPTKGGLRPGSELQPFQGLGPGHPLRIPAPQLLVLRQHHVQAVDQALGRSKPFAGCGDAGTAAVRVLPDLS